MDNIQDQPEAETASESTTSSPSSTSSAVGTEDQPQTQSVEELRGERDRYYDLLLRKTAEFDNYRKRTERERLNLTEAAAADLIQELLPLVDDLERALKAETPDGAEPYRRGVELIHRQLTEALRKRGVRPIEALGTEFDPYYHQAVAHEPAEGLREGEIIEEFRRGYMLGDRLLRPSMVKVAKGQQ
jgi:molecular chaperone GrpE